MKGRWIFGLTLLVVPYASAAQNGETGKLQVFLDATLVRESRIQLSPSKNDQLRRVIRELRNDTPEAAHRSWEKFVTEVVRNGTTVDFDSVISYVLRTAYIEEDPTALDMIDEIRFLNTQKAEVRAMIARTRRSLDFLRDPEEITKARKFIARLRQRLDELTAACDSGRAELEESIEMGAMQLLAELLAQQHEVLRRILGNIRA